MTVMSMYRLFSLSLPSKQRNKNLEQELIAKYLHYIRYDRDYVKYTGKIRVGPMQTLHKMVRDYSSQATVFCETQATHLFPG